MAGLSGYLYPAKETLSNPLIAKPGDRSAGSPEESGIEVEETASGYSGQQQDALTNSTTIGGKDSSTSSSSQSGSMSSNSEITLSGENNRCMIQK
jgi:hypothetical protein